MEQPIKTNKMLKGKILGIFIGLPNESFTIIRLCELSNSKKKEIEPIILLLLKEKKIAGKTKFKLIKQPIKKLKK